MTFQPTGPGKSAPKLFQDFLAFDPLRGKPNVLADSSPPQGDGPQIAPSIGSCKHDYTVKVGQSVPPPLDLRFDDSSHYKLAVVCKKCRIHSEIQIDYSNATNPCPGSQRQLHHFQRLPTYDHAAADSIRYAWRCSAEHCHAMLLIIFGIPRIKDTEKDLLANPERLKRRYDELVQQDPTREGIREAMPVESLQRLRRYIKDSLNTQHNKRQFPANNKRFQEAFGIDGKDCQALLERLGFRYEDHNWQLPDPPEISDRLQTDGTSHREVLEDVEIELLAWTFKISSELGQPNPAAMEGWPSANRDIERMFAAQGYNRYAALRRPPNEDIPFYTSLGVLPDFADSLVEYFFDRQTLCDPSRQPYYFECLQIITSARNTEHLQTKIALLESQDMVSRRDLTAAYRFFSIPLAGASEVDDRRIVELYAAQQPDLGAAAQAEARMHLYKLGVHRRSDLLMNASRQAVETYEDALFWLGNGVGKETSDEGILAVLAIKTADSQANEEIGQKAISVIARARKSNMLNTWLATGRTDGYTMSVDEALRHLNIEEKLSSIDPTVIPVIFDNARKDRPGEMTDRAIKTIEEALASGQGAGATHSPDTWPVGLTSHGNTCYLNSLLQYYFSIRPLRDIILNYEHYQLDTSACTEKTERVGQRKISMVEIKGGQRFARDLKQLFERMIKDPGSAVKPDEDLVCRAFLEPKDYALLASAMKEDMHSSSDPKADHATPVVNGTEEQLIDLDMPENTSVARSTSSASSTTLQASASGDDLDVKMKTTELPLTPPASPGLDGQEPKTMPEHAPPLPPRRFSTTKEEALSRAQENARQQQDVTEVHDGVLFRLRSGMKSRDQDDNEEQEDALRDLFSIRIAETFINKGVYQKPKVLTDSSIQLDVPLQETNIYSALDAVFDLQSYEENTAMKTFKSIVALPPLLQINIPRIGFDKDRPGGAFKSTECVILEDVLYLDRYFDDSHQDILPRRKQSWEWRSRLQALKKEKKALGETDMGVDGPTAIAQTAAYLTSLDNVNRELQSIDVDPIEADGDITAALSAYAERQAHRLVTLEHEADDLQKKLDAQFSDLKSHKYRLAAVFFHRGGHGHGHYWIYIHDLANNLWRSYNDERVEEFTKMEDIFTARTWQQGTPTYAVYVAEKKLDFVQAICRAPEKVEIVDPMSTSVPESVETSTTNVKPEHEVDDPLLGSKQSYLKHEVIDPTLVMDESTTEWREAVHDTPDRTTW